MTTIMTAMNGLIVPEFILVRIMYIMLNMVGLFLSSWNLSRPCVLCIGYNCLVAIKNGHHSTDHRRDETRTSFHGYQRAGLFT